MDLINLKPKSDTVEITIKHPSTFSTIKNDDKTEMTITVYATHSKEYKSVMHEQTNKRLKQMQTKKKVEINAQDIEDAGLELLAKITADWNITYGGEQPKLTVAKAKEVYNELFWIRSQIEEALEEALDFTKA